MTLSALKIAAIALLATLAFACGDDEAAPETMATPQATPTPAPAVTRDATFTPTLEGAALIEALRGGGYVIVFRHALTDMSQVDDLAPILRAQQEGAGRDPSGDCTVQRNLNQAGRDQARAIGKEIDRLAIPHADVQSSPYCRNQDTAGLAFGKYTLSSQLSQIIGSDPGDVGANALRSMLATKPAAGTNTFLITHQSNTMIISLPPLGEGDCFVIQPAGASWRLVAQIKAADWQNF